MTDDPTPIELKQIERDRLETKKEEGWTNLLQRYPHGEPMPTPANAAACLTHEAVWRGMFAWDERTQNAQIIRPLPPCSVAVVPKGLTMTEAHVTYARIWFGVHRQVNFSGATMRDAIEADALRHVVNPLKDYLNGLVWDRKKRVDRWLTRYMCCEEDLHVAVVGAKWLLSAVARALEPGCKADYVIIFEGGQGAGKSTAIAAMCQDPSWFLETTSDLASPAGYHLIAGKWIVELSELDSLSRAETTRIKGFLTARHDSYRRVWRRDPIDQPKGCVFSGTTNKETYLRDDTGDRRYWPVKTLATAKNPIRVDRIVRDRDQIWAEAVHRYKRGEKWHIDDPDLMKHIEAKQEQKHIADPMEDAIAHYLDTVMRKPDGPRNTTMNEVLGYLRKHEFISRIDRPASTSAGSALARLGWSKSEKVSRGEGPRVFVYRPKAPK